MKLSNAATRFIRIRESLFDLASVDTPEIKYHSELANFLTKSQVHMSLCGVALHYPEVIAKALQKSDAGNSVSAERVEGEINGRFESHFTRQSPSGLF
jgi:hypothetical protein